jgi:methyl-accepting chemotaxis protein
VQVAERSGKLLDELVPAIKKTADLVQEVASASREQAAGVNQMNKAMGQVDQVTQRNASAAEEMSSTAEELSSQAEGLMQLMAFFRTDDSTEPVAHRSRQVNHKAANFGSWQAHGQSWTPQAHVNARGDHRQGNEDLAKGHGAGL